MQRTFLFLFLLASSQLFAQTQHTHAAGRAIKFPDIPGFQTLTCDFHMHTVFSDGNVWPNIRVEEALKDSLDVIAITEHLEYQPHLADIPHPDRNRAFELATQSAKAYDLLVIPGSEITRRLPPGHVNAIFVQDANKMLIQDSLEVFREAERQGAFTFWNHPNWLGQRRDAIAKLTDFHRFLIKENLLHGIEVVNDLTYSDEALQIALDNNLTIIGTSDVHGLVDWQYDVPNGGHRPITLVFATEKTPEAIKEALLNRRTVAYFNNLLIGREEHLLPLIESCLTIEKATYEGVRSVLNIDIKNTGDAPFILVNNSDFTFHANSDVIMIEPHTTTTLQLKTLQQLESLELPFTVLNGITAPKTHPEIVFKIKL